MATIRDNPEVRVFDGDLNRALKNFNRRFQNAGVGRILKMRRKHPARCDRLRAKRQRSLERYQRAKMKGKVK